MWQMRGRENEGRARGGSERSLGSIFRKSDEKKIINHNNIGRARYASR